MAALKYWAANTVADFALDNFDTIAQLKRDEAYQLLKTAPDRDRDRMARRGTEVHGYAAQIIAGVEVDVPDDLVGHVDSYLKFLGDFDVQPILVEAVVGNRTHKWMGTLDLIADFNDGLRRLFDIKTARSGIFPTTALQLAAYRNAEFYLDADGNEQPMLAVDACRRRLGPRRRLRPVPLTPARRLQGVPSCPGHRPVGEAGGIGELSVGDVIQPTAGGARHAIGDAIHASEGVSA